MTGRVSLGVAAAYLPPPLCLLGRCLWLWSSGQPCGSCGTPFPSRVHTPSEPQWHSQRSAPAYGDVKWKTREGTFKKKNQFKSMLGAICRFLWKSGCTWIDLQKLLSPHKKERLSIIYYIYYRYIISYTPIYYLWASQEMSVFLFILGKYWFRYWISFSVGPSLSVPQKDAR